MMYSAAMIEYQELKTLAQQQMDLGSELATYFWIGLLLSGVAVIIRRGYFQTEHEEHKMVIKNIERLAEEMEKQMELDKLEAERQLELDRIQRIKDDIEAEAQRVRDEKAEQQRQYEWNLANSPLYNHFNAIDGDEYHTTLYYLKTFNEFGLARYKVGITVNDVEKRYAGQQNKYEILFEKRIANARQIENEVIKFYKQYITDEPLLKTKGSEIFDRDVLKLDMEVTDV